MTWHRAVGKSRKVNSEGTPRQELKDQWADKTIMIIDEVSMLSAEDLAFLDRRLQLLKGNTCPFGGVHMVLVGDMAQLPPVGKLPVYLPKAMHTKVSPEAAAGIQRWSETLNSVVVLENNYRYGADKAFEAMLNRVQDGQPTPTDLAVFNTRMIASATPVASDPSQETLFIVPGNSDRKRLNDVYFQHVCSVSGPQTASWRERGCLQIDAPISHRVGKRTKGRDLSRAETARIRSWYCCESYLQG